MSDKRKITLDNSTEASNPGQIEFDYLVWFKHDTLKAIKLFAMLPLFMVLAININALFFIGLAIALFINVFYWIRSKEHFTADSNPGMIVSVSPPLYAVYSDLTKWGGHYPAIKIEKYRSRKEVKIGDKIATVAVYSDEGGDDAPSWSDFFPLPVEYATNDKKNIEREMKSYSDENWKNLEFGTKSLNKVMVGLFKLQTDSSDW